MESQRRNYTCAEQKTVKGLGRQAGFAEVRLDVNCMISPPKPLHLRPLSITQQPSAKAGGLGFGLKVRIRVA